jgi:hypothetical protein
LTILAKCLNMRAAHGPVNFGYDILSRNGARRMGSRDNVSLRLRFHKSLLHRHFVREWKRHVRHSVSGQINAHSHVGQFVVT